MSMQSYISAHCRAAQYDRHYDSREFFGGGEDWEDDPVPAKQTQMDPATSYLFPTTERVVGVVENAAGSLADNFELVALYASSAQSPRVNQADVPPIWQAGIDELDRVERRVLSDALKIPVYNLGIMSVGIVRRLPDTELVKAKGIGRNKAAILKALGHNADQETKLMLVVSEDRAGKALKPEAIE